MTVQVFVTGDHVECDDCSKDYTDSLETGGIAFSSKAICPDCTPRWEALAKKYNEESEIKGRCPPGVPFAVWVRGVLRGGEPGKITITSGEDFAL